MTVVGLKVPSLHSGGRTKEIISRNTGKDYMATQMHFQTYSVNYVHVKKLLLLNQFIEGWEDNISKISREGCSVHEGMGR
jgi:hypothetical protein